MEALADWVTSVTDNGQVDVLVLYGDLPPTLYPDGNALPEGSVGELFIESTDGDAILNHADYMFWGLNARNQVGGLENMMDIPGIVMWPDDPNPPMVVTPQGKDIAPSLTDFTTDRPFHVDQLANEWTVEVALAQNEAGTRADPIIVRDGPRGRLVPVFQTNGGNNPKGAVAAEIIAHLLGVPLPNTPSKLALFGKAAAWAGDPIQVTVQLQEPTGSPRPKATPVTVNLQTDSGTGRFDTAAGGSFNGSVTSITIPAGETTGTFFYKDTAAGAHVLTASAAGLDQAKFTMNVFVKSKAPPGEVAIYTGTTQWIAKDQADAQAQIASDALGLAGIPTTLYPSDQDMQSVADWVVGATQNGKLDVLVLYGDLPPSIYPDGNAQPDGSPAELYIESTDGDAILNHADYMFWGLNARNQTGGLENMMDLPGIVMWDDDTCVAVTDEGKQIAPSLTGYGTDRPFHLDQLGGSWLAEAILAQNAAGTRADPVIVRDGNRGRLIPVFQTNGGNEPKGTVAAEIISWLMGVGLSAPAKATLAGPATAVTGKPIKLRVHLQDANGNARRSTSATTVSLTADSATGVFDTQWGGSFDGSVHSVTIPAGGQSAPFFFKETAPKLVKLTAAATGLEGSEQQINVLADVPVAAGEVVIYTGTTQWLAKPLADEQAQISADKLNAAGFSAVVLSSDQDMQGVADWMQSVTQNGNLDVLVLDGDFPPTIYPEGNASPDDSLAELYIESTDGDVIMNHADYMFWGLNARNQTGGLENMMDIPGIVMWDDNTCLTVTDEGKTIAPSLTGFQSDRPFHIDQLANDWFPEVVLAENAAGTRADPIIVRDGNRGRLIPVFQTADQNDPKGAVAAEIITWLLSNATGPTAPAFHRGDSDDNGQLQLTDAVRILGFLFLGGVSPTCLDAADSDNNGQLQLTDAVRILGFLFLGGAPPATPGPPGGGNPCGSDPGDVHLGCASYTKC
jgi:hypothetical protein